MVARPAQTSMDMKNHKIHMLFTRKDYDKCLELIERVLQQPLTGLSYYPLFTKAMIYRQQGLIKKSMSTLEDAIRLDPQNEQNLKQIGHSLYLMGKHQVALDVYDEALKQDASDWETYHNKGMCYVYLRDLSDAEVMFRKAIDIEAHETSYQQLGKVLVMQEDMSGALDTFHQALDHTPESSDTLCQIGLLHLRQGDNVEALRALESSSTLHPRHPKAVLAMGSILQDNLDIDGALVKYRVAASIHPDSPQVWNNVGLCFFGKQRYISAIACLKHALYLGPFEWTVCYNLGLVHINTQQYAAAFNYFSAAINLKPSFPNTYMYLGVTLARLGDFDNACHSYNRAIEKDGQDALFRLNFAVTLQNMGHLEKAREQMHVFKGLYAQLSEDVKDPDMVEQATLLMSVLAV